MKAVILMLLAQQRNRGQFPPPANINFWHMWWLTHMLHPIDQVRLLPVLENDVLSSLFKLLY